MPCWRLRWRGVNWIRKNLEMKNARRGEVWIVDLGMIAKVRPALILSTSFNDDERALYAAVPHTTSTRGGRFEVSLPVRFLDKGAFDLQSLGPVRPTMLVRKVGALNEQQMAQVETVAKRWLDLEQA